MTVILNDRRDFTLDNARRIAWQREPVQLGPRAQAAISGARKSFLDLLESDRSQFIYGTTTAGGEGARHRLTPEQQKALTRRPQQSLGSSFGDPLPERVTRAIVLARLSNYIEGNGKVRFEFANWVADMLNNGPLPQIPSRGTTWAGETTIPARLFGHLRANGLEEGEGMALVNGSCASAGLGADAALRARKRVAIVEHVMALSIEAMNAPLEAYDPALKDLWGDPYEAQAIDALNRLLAGTATEGRRDYQAPVSYRIIPRVLGQMYRAVAQLEKAAQTSLASVSDNPVYILPDAGHPLGRAFSTGGYHNGMVYPALDWVSQIWAELCGLCDRHNTKLMRGDVSLMPHRLAHPDHPYQLRFDVTQVQWGEEARAIAREPSFIPMSEGGGSVQDDTPAPGMIAWRKENQVAECLDACLAMLAATSSQALHVTGRQPAPPLRQFLTDLREIFPPVATLRDQGVDGERLMRAFSQAALSPDPDCVIALSA